MRVNELAEELGLNVINRGKNWQRDIEGGYVSDLLSDVMGNIDEGMIWITLQTHRNIVAVASLKEVAAVVLIGGAKVEGECMEEIVREDLTVLSTDMPAFETAARCFNALG